jgi:4-hydroxy-tetrahydrodipicolinate synthase
MRLEGCIPPMVTPVTESGAVAEDVLRSYAGFLADADVHALFPCGSTGEFTSLSREQRETVVSVVADAAPDVPVLAGCGDTNPERVATLVADAAKAGADAAVVVTPYYLETTQERLQAFYRRVADRAPIPVVLYEFQSVAGHSFDVDTAVALAEHGNIVGLKISAGDSLRIYELAGRTPADFAVVPGFPELTVQALDFGCDGIVAGPANVFPDAVAAVYEAYVAGDRERAVDRLNEVVMPVLSAIRSMPTVPALRYLLTRRGFDVGSPLAPLPRLDDDQRHDLDVVYDELVPKTTAASE